MIGDETRESVSDYVIRGFTHDVAQTLRKPTRGCPPDRVTSVKVGQNEAHAVMLNPVDPVDL